MKERGIIFTGPSIPAILDGRKTQTRWVVKPQPPVTAYKSWMGQDGHWRFAWTEDNEEFTKGWRCPYGVPGDRLWVRETFWCCEVEAGGIGHRYLVYDADWPAGEREPPTDLARPWPCEPPMRWGKHPSIHMPRWASRIDLEIADVRAERVQEISEAEAEAEGVVPPGCTHPECGPDTTCAMRRYRPQFARLWDSINAKRGFGWDANPWVWVIEFKRSERCQT